MISTHVVGRGSASRDPPTFRGDFSQPGLEALMGDLVLGSGVENTGIPSPNVFGQERSAVCLDPSQQVFVSPSLEHTLFKFFPFDLQEVQ